MHVKILFLKLMFPIITLKISMMKNNVTLIGDLKPIHLNCRSKVVGMCRDNNARVHGLNPK